MMLKELLIIDEQLRIVFAQVERVLAAQFDSREIDRIFSDSAHDQVSEKRYVFYQSGSNTITGVVDEYEPETIWLQLDIDKSLIPACSKVLNGL